MAHQKHLLPNDPLPPAITPPPGVALAVNALSFGAGAMSPAQKRFNQLLKQTETLAQKIEDTRKLADAHRLVAERTLVPLQKMRIALMRQMAVWLDARLQRKGLSAKQKAIATEILCHLAAQVANTGDVAMHVLYEAHSDSSLAEEEAATAANMKMFMEDILGEDMGDDDTPFERLDDLLRASMAKMQEKAATEEAARASHQNKRKKTAAQLKAEVKATAQLKDATGALRTIYRQLVSALHPDRETDPHEQLRKTGLMKEANAAYEKRDLLGLLQLQLRAELTHASQMAHLAKEKMAALTTLLKDRVSVLTDELYAAERQMIGEFNLPMFSTLSATALRRHLNECEQNLQEEISQMKQDLTVVQDDTRFKRWLREQQKASQDAFTPLDFF
ncbi:MAG: hypothetical protein PHQ58_12540 [Rhodoferax sp.]|uniref:hypothetical protein n=1 Tax=Rhodoferax sp. TaxID=50421 RepID=UPI0026156DD0|nr:hypothetical protein [Rhodoferax sp.]MDD2881256.1 hypothetical protein [Rhodoferax sp.]